MAWYIDSVQIFPTSVDDAYDQAIARLQPLLSGTIYHIFGYEYDIKKISAYIVGNADRLALISCNRDAAVHHLFEDLYDWGDYYVKNVSFKREPVVYQTIRPDLDCGDPVYTAEIELYQDEDA